MKPILFNTEMVRAILEGRKTVTRRVIKLPKRVQEQENGLYTLYTEGTVYENFCIEQIVDYISPYQVNDILYVRETWCKLPVSEYGNLYTAGEGVYYYKADGEKRPQGWRGNWKPSIHMPKEAARLFLRVTGVSVKKLRDMELEDFIKEGIILSREDMKNHDTALYKARELFKDLWNSTAGKPYSPERYANSWIGNPYVWVIEFEVITAEQAQGK